MSGAVPSDKEALRLLQIGPLDAVIADLDMHEVAACQLPTKMRCFPIGAIRWKVRRTAHQECPQYRSMQPQGALE
jgi:hypothetical protein